MSFPPGLVYIEFDDDGDVISMTGKCQAKDFRKEAKR